MFRPLAAISGVALTLVLPAFASAAADRYVSTTGSDATNDCLTVATPCATIAQAVTEAASGDTIKIAAGTYTGAGNVDIDINEAKNLTFKGAGSTATIIDGGGTHYLFRYEASPSPFTVTASFKDLALQNAYGSGGAAVSTGNTVTSTVNLSRVSVHDNSVEEWYDGGAIRAREGNVAICDSTFADNSASIGGAIAAMQVTIANCASSPEGTPAATFTDNAASKSWGGGAIYATKVTADNAIFDGNETPNGPGGAIAITTASTEATALDLSHVTFTDNLAWGGGGAFRVGSGGDVTVADSTFDNNDTTSSSGGAFRTDGGDVTISRSTISGSNAPMAAGADVMAPGTLAIDDSTISGNTADVTAALSAGGELNLMNSTLSGNIATSYGLLYSPTAIRLRSVTSSGNPVLSSHFFAPDLEVVNSIIDEPGRDVCSGAATITGGGNVLTTGVTGDCNGLASPTPTSRVTSESVKLGPLADNGGPTTTMSIGHGSTALGIGGSPNACPTTDQRGEDRPVTDCDAGAFERPSFDLVVATSGAGSGTVTGAPTDSTPGSIDCGTDCSASFDQDTPVALTATPASGSVLTGWSGACSDAASTCTVTMSEARSVTATFGIAPPASAATTGSQNGSTPGPTPAPARRNRMVIGSTASIGSAIVTRLVVAAPGTVVQQGTFATGRPAATAVRPACRATVVARRAGRYSVVCHLNAAARRQQARRALRVRIRTTFTPTGGAPRSTVRTVLMRPPKARVAG